MPKLLPSLLRGRKRKIGKSNFQNLQATWYLSSRSVTNVWMKLDWNRQCFYRWIPLKMQFRFRFPPSIIQKTKSTTIGPFPSLSLPIPFSWIQIKGDPRTPGKFAQKGRRNPRSMEMKRKAYFYYYLIANKLGRGRVQKSRYNFEVSWRCGELSEFISWTVNPRCAPG